MSILIKGMEMPTSCYKCYLKQRNGMDLVCPVLDERFSIADVNILYYRLDNCPLVPVPPHGRLIDADALRYWSDDSAMIAFDYVTRSQINAAPTIIEEEGE